MLGQNKLQSLILRSELLVGQGTSLEQRIPEQVRVMPVVEPPLQLVQVGVQMLDRQLVLGASDRPLQKAPDAFDGLGVGIMPHHTVLSQVCCYRK